MLGGPKLIVSLKVFVEGVSRPEVGRVGWSAIDPVSRMTCQHINPWTRNLDGISDWSLNIRFVRE